MAGACWGNGVGLLTLSVRASVFPFLTEMEMAELTWQGRGQDVLSNRVKAELNLYHLGYLPRPFRGCRLVPARARVRLQRPHCSEGRRCCPQGIPAPSPTSSPVEQMTWPGVDRAGRVLCLLGGAGCPMPAPHSVGRQSPGRREPSQHQRCSRLPTSRLLPSKSVDWSALLQRGREAGGSRG